MRGLKSLKKRVAEGEIVVCQTDKSGRFAVMTMADYEYAGSKHVRKDQEVNLPFVKQNQDILNGHCSMWLKIFLVGRNWGHEDRHRETKLNHSLCVSPLYLLFKDHKGWSFGMPGEPPSRPIASTTTSQNTHLSEMISEVVEPIAAAFKHW